MNTARKQYDRFLLYDTCAHLEQMNGLDHVLFRYQPAAIRCGVVQRQPRKHGVHPAKVDDYKSLPRSFPVGFSCV